ncbi:MAG: acyl-CoA dehydrogenase [Bacteroidetes bacterium]|nr:MAG: acyl-CoA dehydrogenase [Bacteroidota bacterium]
MGFDNLKLKNVSARDLKLIADIEKMMGPEPETMGFAKNMFWGRFQEEMVVPYPEVSADEKAECDALLVILEDYLKNEHPSIQIDQEERIPQWCIDKLFDMGVMGMTVPVEYGGLNLGISSYNRVLEMLGAYCGSSAVMVSAHQSIGCKAIMLFGTEEQKKVFLPGVARQYLSAFCLSEPNVGSDAAGQETRCVLSEDGKYFILNGEKKWSTSGAISGVYTVMAKQMVVDPKTGKEKEAVTALICTPDMDGIDVFENNRSKTGIRGTWQARIRFTDVRVPRENVLHKEGRGLQVALTCLNFGRCTLSAGVTGGAKRAMDQSIKWVQTRYQFERPLADFELVQMRIARMSAYCFAMDAALYLMTGMLDRGDSDIMVETAITKVLCSELGWLVIDDAMEIMGGEGYVAENELERVWRDNRIHRIVEGSNEVMLPFIFAYGGKQLAEQMFGIQDAVNWDSERDTRANIRRIASNLADPRFLRRAIPLAAQLFAGIRPSAPRIETVDESLSEYSGRLSRLIRKHSHMFKMASKWYREDIVTKQTVQARLANSAVYLFALSASLAKMDSLVRSSKRSLEYMRDSTAFEHAFDLLEKMVNENLGDIRSRSDVSMARAAEAARQHNDSLPNKDFYIHEESPIAKGTGKKVRPELFKSFKVEDKQTSSTSPVIKPVSAGDGFVDDADIRKEIKGK